MTSFSEIKEASITAMSIAVAIAARRRYGCSSVRYDDPRILPELPGELPIRDVDGVDPCRPAWRRQSVNPPVEAPRRGVRPAAEIRRRQGHPEA